jgi:hypothetical protein
MLKRSDLVVQLHEHRLRCHFPIYTEAFLRLRILRLDAHPLAPQKSLPLRPNCASRVKRLQLNSNEIARPSAEN